MNALLQNKTGFVYYRFASYCWYALLVVFFSLLINDSKAQVTLGASPYTENFDGIGAGYPTGWSGRFGSTNTQLGMAAGFVNAATAWNNSTGNFRNCASADAPSAAGDATGTQNGRTDRAFAVRTTGGFGDGQHAFALQIANTTGKYGFQISFKAQLLDPQGRTLSYLIDYGFGATPGSFTQAAAPYTFTDLGINGGAWGQTTITVNFGAAIDNNASNVWIRIANLTTSTGSGNRCTFGIDDVNLTWSTVPAGVALSSPNPSVPAGTIIGGSTNNLLYRADVSVTNSATSLTALNITTAGTYVASDITNFKLWYQNSIPFNSATATLIATKTTGLGAGVQSFAGLNQPYPIGTGYLFVTTDLACGAIATNTINIATPLASNFTFGVTVPTGTLFAGGSKQILALAPLNVTAASTVPGNGELDIVWTNPLCYDEIMIVATDDAGGVTSVPTGNGSLYTQNTIYNDGTNFINLNPNEFCIYKGAVSPVTMTNLINGTTYYMKIFTRLGSTWSSGTVCTGIPAAASNGDFRSRASGNWNDFTTWQIFSGTWIDAISGQYPNSVSSTVTIRTGHTVTLNVNGISVRNLVVDGPTGKLNGGGNSGTPRYLSVFGNTITCNGTIGDVAQDDISFNIEGINPAIGGTGSFSCNRIRKNTGINLTTTLTVNMNITTWWNGAAIFNNYTGDPNSFNVTIASGRTVTCTNSGSVSIDGTTGTAFGSSYGSITVNGTLNVGGTLFMRTNNLAPYNCSVNIGATGIINANAVSMDASTGTATHTFSIASGGKLNLTGGNQSINPFSTTGNVYNLNAGSTVEYSSAGVDSVETGLSYSNLTISGSGNKCSRGGNVSVGNTFALNSGTFSQYVAPVYYTVNIAAGGTLTGNGGNFAAGNAGGTLNFVGAGTINGTTALGFNILKINTGTVTNTLNNSTCDTLNLTGGTFSIGSANTFNMLASGVVTATAGNFAVGVNGGILNFQGAGKFIGNSSPYNVYTSGGVDFGSGTVTIQANGSFRINSGGFADTNGPFYADNSTLVYNNGSTFGAGPEWYALFSSGRGVPFNVQIGTSAVINTKLSFGSSTAWRQMNGNLFIGPSSGGSGYGFIISDQSGGDLYIRGSWTRTAATATFTTAAPRQRAVIFNGTSGDQTITVLGGGTEVFAYLIINKTAGQKLVIANVPDATDLTVNGGSGGNSLQLINGDLDLNGRTFNFTSWFNSNQNNIGIDGTAGNLTRNITSSAGTGTFAVYHTDPATRTMSIGRMTGNASLLVVSSSVTVTTGAQLGGFGGMNFGNGLTTINGTLQINSYGFVNPFAPTYGTNSFLVYNASGIFDRNVEWGALSGAGYPFHVTVQNNTFLRLNFPNPNGDANRAIAGDLTISNGSTILQSTTNAGTLTVGRDFILNGTLIMPTVLGGDIYVGRNWNRNASTGFFIHNNRAVFFNSAANSTITANGDGQYFPYLYLTKSALSNTLSLLDNIRIGKEFGITTGTFDPATKDATLLSNDTTQASFGKVGAQADVAYSGTGRFIVERYIKTGTAPGQHLKSWQLLAVPTNGGQTVNAAWQEGATFANQNLVPGYGTQITSNIAPIQPLFDALTTPASGPSMKTFNPAGTGSWVGIANTTTLPLYNPKGYMIFVRGDRSVTTFSGAGSTPVPTNLRSRGKLFVPGSNPPPSTTVLAGKFESIGNPYASTIDFLNITKPAAPAVDDVFYVWDPLLPGANSLNLGGYQTISLANSYWPSPGGTTNYPSGVPFTKIQSGQAFLVHSTSGGGTVSFTENAKSSGYNDVFRIPVSQQSSHFLRTILYDGSGRLMDEVVVAFNNRYSNQYDASDALKMINAGASLGAVCEGKIVAIEARKPVMRRDTVHLTFSGLKQETYQFRFGPEHFPANGVEIFLADRYLGTRHAISSGDSTYINFDITGDPGSGSADRFILVFNKQNGPVRVNTIAETTKEKGKGKGEQVPVPGQGGINVYPNPVVNGNISIFFNGQPEGLYLVRLLNSMGQVVKEQTFAVTGENSLLILKANEALKGSHRLVITAADGTKTTRQVILQ